jgi:hypothetical protein
LLPHWGNSLSSRSMNTCQVGEYFISIRTAAKCSRSLGWPLTPEEGKPRLKEMLEGVKAIMRLSKDKHDFWEKMEIAYPKLNDANLLLPFVDLPRLERPK